MTRRNRGYSIVELAVVVAIMGVLLAIGLPSFRELIINYQIRAMAESISNGLQAARATAVQRNENIEFTLTIADGKFTREWTVRPANTPTDIVQTHAAGNSSSNLVVTGLPLNSATVTFNSLGRVVSPNADASIPLNTIKVDVPTTVLAADESPDLSIRVLNGGLVKLCNPNVTDASDVRKCP